MPAIRLEATVHGMVQGVGFRYSTVRQARAIGGITGYVRNLGDGSVEVLAEGARERLEQLERWLREGPAGSIVSRVDTSYAPATGQWGEFDVDF